VRNLSRKILTRKDGSKKIDYYSSPKFKPLQEEELALLDVEYKVWAMGEKMYKIAAEYYGDERYWWVIAWFNNKPTDSHFEEGDTVAIPSLSVLEYT